MATGISISSTSNLSSGQKILIAAARTANEPAAPDPDLWNVEKLPTGHKDFVQNTFARLATASALTEGVDLAEVQQLVTATSSITPTEHGIISTPSKRLIARQGDASVVGTIGKLLGISLRIREALDVITLYDSFTKSIGGAGSTMDVAYYRGANAFLMTDPGAAYGPAMPPFFSSLHIEQISDIIMDISSTNDKGATQVGATQPGMSQEMLQAWWKASDRLYGTQIFHGGNITRDASSDSKGCIAAKDSMTLVHAVDADPTEEVDNSMRVVEYGLFQVWGEAQVVDAHGVEVYSNSAATV